MNEMRTAASRSREMAERAAGEFNDWYALHELEHMQGKGGSDDVPSDAAFIHHWSPDVAYRVADLLDLIATAEERGLSHKSVTDAARDLSTYLNREPA